MKLESSQRWITQPYLSSPASSEYPADGTGPVGVGSSTLEVWYPGEVQTLTWQWVCGDKRGRETRWSDFPQVTWRCESKQRGEVGDEKMWGLKLYDLVIAHSKRVQFLTRLTYGRKTVPATPQSESSGLRHTTECELGPAESRALGRVPYRWRLADDL